MDLALLADRDADTRLMYAEYLRQLTYEIDEAEDGREALAKAISRHPTVIVTETRLPGMSGYELCRLLRNDPVTILIPIIVVTGDAFPSDVTCAEAAGADAVLVKPCLPERLAAEMRRVRSQSSELRARGRAARENFAAQVTRSDELIARSQANGRRVMLSRAHPRRDTTGPPTPPPALVCPACLQPLRYVKSHIGGVSERYREQWDYFECARGCGTFQYRPRTRKVRRVG
jgi:two-component system, chemotaxis family, response regulator PixH